MTTFAALGVPTALVRSLTSQGITDPFPIQVKTLPDTLAGRDVLGRGRTGSGKTLAFALPMVARLAEREAAYRRKPGRPLGLVLAPTRELATQINATVEPLAHELGLNTTVIYGGVSQARQEKALRAGVDIIIACPGRLEDLMRQKLVTLESVEITVLDEADHMADLGFLPVVKKLLDTTPTEGQRMLFSATLDNGVDKIVHRYLSNPLTHSVDTPQASVTTMEHHVLLIGDQTQKKQLIVQLASGQGKRVLFMRTKHQARKLAKTLTDAGIPAVDLHGNLSQNARDRNLAEFSTGGVRVLVATDVAARGVHVDDVELVVHVDPPTEHKAYLHRSGRTARAGSDGTVVTVTLPEQKSEVQKLMKAAGVTVGFENVSATSPLVAKLIGDVAEKVDPRTRAALLANREGAGRGAGTSTGANAERKRARRAAPSAGGRGGRGGRGRVAAEPQGNRAERRKDQPQAPRFGTDGDRRRTSEGATTAGGNRNRRSRGARSGDVAAQGTGSHSNGARSGQSAAQAGSGQRSGGQRSAASSSGRPAGARRSGPRRATAPASNERRGR